MLCKLDVRSCRVKGVAFHKQRPWVLCGLHNGVVQIWDYRMNTSVDTYLFSEGGVPTRGVDFHETQPLFVTGSDDHLVRVWNYNLRRCLYVLSGHIDYVRTTYFHRDQPWIISCSDDYIVRIWNWQNRTCIATLPGHNHYVMCAQFHPESPLVASASLDKTIRLWDISELYLKKQEAGIAQDLLGSSNATLRHVLEGHNKAVNWVSFGPNDAYNRITLVSASDDRTVITWALSPSNTKWFLEQRYTGHNDNVCCATYFKDKYIISCGEDRVIKVFLLSGQNIMTFRRDADRYWILSTLSSKNLIAAGHDTGLQVFKLFRERPAFALHNETLYFVHENVLYVQNLETNTVDKFNNFQRGGTHPPSSISVSSSDMSIAVTYKFERDVVELIQVPKPGGSCKTLVTSMDEKDAIFFGPKKFAFIGENRLLFVCNTQDNKVKTLDSSLVCERLFAAPAGCVLCQTSDKVVLYHVAQRSVIAEVTAVDTRQAIWDKDFHKVALVSKNAILILTKRLKLITTIKEPSTRIKSCVFDEKRDVAFYSTSNHIKFCILRTGEVSTVGTIKTVIYLVRAVEDRVWMLTRSGKVVARELDNIELNFKLKLHQQSFRDVIKIVKSNELKGQALVGYLHKHGFSEIALHFVKDPLTRFNLALECGALDIAKDAAADLNDPAVWRRLSDTAVNFGDVQLAQLSNSKAGNVYGSALHMLYTGNMSALGHLVDSTDDDNFKLHYGLFLNDYEKKVEILLKSGQLPLAYLTAKSNGMSEVAENILQKMDPETRDNISSVTCFPPQPNGAAAPKTENWPMLQIDESIFQKLLKQPGQLDIVNTQDYDLDEAAGDAWGDDDDNGSNDAYKEAAGWEGGDHDDEAENEDANENEGWDDDLDIDVNAVLRSADAKSDAGFVVPAAQPPLSSLWSENSSLVAFHVAAGKFSSAFHLLKSQIGLKNPAPLKEHALLLWSTVNVSRPGWLNSSVLFNLNLRNTNSTQVELKYIPQLPKYMPSLLDSLKVGYQLFVEGKFVDAHAIFENILHRCVFTVVFNDQERASFRELLTVVSEYTRALVLQLAMRGLDGSSNQALELSLYFTHFKLQRPHLILGLSQSMSKAYKKKNFKTAASVARRLLEQDPPKNKAQQAAAIIAEADQNPVDTVEVNYDERNPFVLCSETNTPMYKGTVEVIRCGYCLSAANSSFKGKLCSICKISSYGAECSGLLNQI